MGVTYKLKPEIIEEIVKRKTEEPSISCRQLAEEMASRFNVKISKSSVNTVLKKSQLSSSVGRRSKIEYPAKKFEIPSERKKQLLENVEKTGLGKNIDTSKENDNIPRREKQPKPAPIIESSALPKEKLSSDEVHKKEEIKEPSKEIYLEEKEKILSSPSVQQINNIRERRKSGWGEIFDGMGFVLLKAVFDQIGGNLKTLSFLERTLGGSLDEKTRIGCEILVDFWMLGVKEFGQIKDRDNHAIWGFYGVKKDQILPVLKDLMRKFKTEEITAETYWGFVRNFEREFINVKEIKVVFSDQSSYLCDGALSGIFLTKPVNSRKRLIGQTMNIVSGELISNSSPLCLYPITNDTNKLDIIYHWLEALNGEKGVKITRVEIHDHNNSILASFSMIPDKRRDFIVGVEPNHPSFGRWTKSTKWAVKEPFYDILGDKILYSCETLCDDSNKEFPLKNREIRIISIYSDQSQEPRLVLISNSETLRNEEIVQKYMERYPEIRFFIENEEKFLKSDQKISENEGQFLAGPCFLSGLDSVKKQFYISDTLDVLFHQIKEWFLQNQLADDINKDSVSNFLSSICEIPGQMQDLDDLKLVKFLLPEDFSYQNIASLLIQALAGKIISQNCRQKVIFDRLK